MGLLPLTYGLAPKPLQKVITKFYEVVGHVWVDLKLVTNRCVRYFEVICTRHQNAGLQQDKFGYSDPNS